MQMYNMRRWSIAFGIFFVSLFVSCFAWCAHNREPLGAFGWVVLVFHAIRRMNETLKWYEEHDEDADADADADADKKCRNTWYGHLCKFDAEHKEPCECACGTLDPLEVNKLVAEACAKRSKSPIGNCCESAVSERIINDDATSTEIVCGACKKVWQNTSPSVWVQRKAQPQPMATVETLRHRMTGEISTRVTMGDTNVCEHGDHSAPEGARFCSDACAQCEMTDQPTEADGTSKGCAEICLGKKPHDRVNHAYPVKHPYGKADDSGRK